MGVTDDNGVLNACYIASTNQLRTTTNAASGPGVAGVDGEGIWGDVFDEAVQAIRVVEV